MTLEDIKKLPTYQTRSIAEAVKAGGEATLFYLLTCINRFYSGDYGEAPPEDTEANNEDLEAGSGHILARYKAAEGLESDIYIEAHFEEAMPESLDANNVMIMYCDER